MLKETKLTRVSEDPDVMAWAKALKEAQRTYDVCACKYKKFALVMDPHQRGTSTRAVSETEALEARSGWEGVKTDLALSEMEVNRCAGKLMTAQKDATQARVPALRHTMREAVSKFYAELARSVMANSEVYAARRLACEILGDSQSEIPDLCWPELLAPMYQGKDDENLLDFRKGPFDSHLPIDRRPVEAQRRVWVGEQLVALVALAIGVEHEAALVEPLEQYHSGRRPPVPAGGRQRHRGRVLEAAVQRLGVPLGKQGDGILSVRYAHVNAAI